MKRRGRRVLLVLLLLFIAGVVTLLASTEWLQSLGGRVRGDRLERARRSAHFADGKFRNAQESRMLTTSYREMFRRQFFGGEQRHPVKPVPVVTRTTRDYATAPASGLRATWMGWSSVLVEIDGRSVLTDPVWSRRCSPSTLVGPKRFHAPPISLRDLPPIDAVVISHDHYDHLDMQVVRALAARGTHFVVPPRHRSASRAMGCCGGSDSRARLERELRAARSRLHGDAGPSLQRPQSALRE